LSQRRASWLELFFDLCLVVAIGALARGLHALPDLAGLARFALLFVPVWWAWMG
jgi:low temperature requirement protein LtrA